MDLLSDEVEEIHSLPRKGEGNKTKRSHSRQGDGMLGKSIWRWCDIVHFQRMVEMGKIQVGCLGQGPKAGKERDQDGLERKI